MDSENMNYYYIFGVRTDTGKDLIPKLSTDFIIDYTDEDVRKCELAKEMVKNELWPTTKMEAVNGVGLSSLNEILNIMSSRARSNMMTIHKVVSKIPLKRRDIEAFVSASNVSESSRKKLVESMIKS